MAGGEFIVFDVAGVRCALPRPFVREILPLPRLHRPPAAPPMLAGFLDLAGRPLPVVALGRLFGLGAGDPPSVYSHLILVDGAARGAIAFLVDRVLDVHVAAEPPRMVADRETLAGSVVGELATDDGLVHVLSPERLLLHEERERIAALAEAAEARLGAWETA